MELVNLACPACGGEAKIDPAANVYVCHYCGSQFQAVYSHGEVSLSPMTHAVKEVTRKLDRTNAELAIARLQGEVGNLLNFRNQVATEYQKNQDLEKAIGHPSIFIVFGAFTLLAMVIIFFLIREYMDSGSSCMLWILFGVGAGLFLRGAIGINRQKTIHAVVEKQYLSIKEYDNQIAIKQDEIAEQRQFLV